MRTFGRKQNFISGPDFKRVLLEVACVEEQFQLILCVRGLIFIIQEGNLFH